MSKKNIKKELLKNSREEYIGSGSDLFINTTRAINIVNTNYELKPSHLSLLIDDCPNCGQEVNRQFVDELTIRIKKETLNEVIDNMVVPILEEGIKKPKWHGQKLTHLVNQSLGERIQEIKKLKDYEKK